MFNNIKKLEKTEVTVWYTIPYLPGNMRVLLRPATVKNKAYQNAVRKHQNKLRVLTNSNSEDDTEYLNILLPLIAKYVVCDFKNILDDNNNVVEYNTEVAEEFLRALPVDIFKELLVFASTPSNFMVFDGEDTAMSEEETVNLAKN